MRDNHTAVIQELRYFHAEAIIIENLIVSIRLKTAFYPKSWKLLKKQVRDRKFQQTSKICRGSWKSYVQIVKTTGFKK